MTVDVSTVLVRPFLPGHWGPRSVFYFRRGGGRSIGSDRAHINHVDVSGRPFLSCTTRKQRARLMGGGGPQTVFCRSTVSSITVADGHNRTTTTFARGPCIRQVPAESLWKEDGGSAKEAYRVADEKKKSTFLARTVGFVFYFLQKYLCVKIVL